jgi:sigma-B regulation protein RsbU (phosphoserine phosphatase)
LTEKIKYILFVAVLIALDIFFVSRAIEFSKIYPFQRIAVDSILLHRITATGGGYRFNSRIISIQDKAVDRKNLASTLDSVRDDRVLNVVVAHGGEIIRREILKKEFNADILWFFIILLLLANIHYLWGLVVKIIRSHISQANLYFYLSIGLSVFHFLLIEFFSYGRLQLFFVMIVIYIGYLILKGGYNLLNQKVRGGTALLYFSIVFIFVLISLYPMEHTRGLVLSVLSLLLIICAMFSFVKILLNFMVIRNIYIVRRGLIGMAIILNGIVIPITSLMLGLHYDLRMPAQFYPMLSVIVPLVAGNGLLQYDIFSSRMFLGTGFTQFFLNILISIVAAVFLFYISNAAISTYQMALLYSLFALLMIFLFYAKRLLRRKLNNALFINKDEYAHSLQNIAELVSLPEDISVKIEKIFSEIKRLTDIVYLRFAVFADRVDEDYSNLEEYVEYFRKESALFMFFLKNRDIIFRYSLMKNSLIEERVYEFLDKRNVILAIPAFKEKSIIGALLVGDKRRDGYLSNSDIRYLETVTFQIQQLFENDRLFRDYIAQSSFERELEIASYIQLRLFPKKAPGRRGLAISFYNRPYLKVTGDYFDFINIDRNNTAIVLGDISGHGLAAAMVLSMTSSITNAMLKEKKSIERTVLEINHFLNFRYRGIELITLFIGIFNKKTREMIYINAGHCTPIFIKNNGGGLSFLEGRSKILGADPSANYFSSKFTLNKRDELFFYTDGVIEIYDEKNNELFSEKNLIELISKNRNLDIQGKINAVLENINRFDGETIKDDITLIGVKVL